MTKEQAGLLANVLTRVIHVQQIATDMLEGVSKELARYEAEAEKQQRRFKERFPNNAKK
jgi:hypothetical protein